jgi:ADP-ribosyl-[dinitrogen reductase] hydrolase
MLGAIAGDIIGSPYEGGHSESLTRLFTHESRITDDTILTIATMRCLMENGHPGLYLKEFTTRYPEGVADTSPYGKRAGRPLAPGYSKPFTQWAQDGVYALTHKSQSNGCVARLSPLACWAFDVDELLRLVERYVRATNDDAPAVHAVQVYTLLLREVQETGMTCAVSEPFSKVYWDYIYQRVLSVLPSAAPLLGADVSGWEALAGGSSWAADDVVKQAIVLVRDAASFEEAVQRAVQVRGGDSDTLAAATGALAEARFGLSASLRNTVRNFIPPELVATVEAFYQVRKLGDVGTPLTRAGKLKSLFSSQH